MPATTLGAALNTGLRTIGDPPITALTSTNILQLTLIDELNNTIAEMMEMGEYDWTLKHTTLTTTEAVTTGSVAATNGSTTVTSVDSDGDNAQNFGSVTTNMWWRLDAEQTSYGIASVDSTSNPNTLTLDTAFVGTTTTAGGYKCFQDTYPITTSDMDEPQIVAYGEGASWGTSVNGIPNDKIIRQVPLRSIYERSFGDPHNNAGGKPNLFAVITKDSSDQQQWILYPYPDEEYVIDIWYSILYSDSSTFSAALLGDDAPAVAYAAIEHRMRMAACMWDKDFTQADKWEGRYREAIGLINRRNNSQNKEKALQLETYRQQYGSVFPVRSGYAFDHGYRR